MATDLRTLLQDAAYVTVGVGVLAFQRAQVARREARGKVEAQIKDAQSRLTSGIEGARSTARDTRGKVEAQIKDARSRIEPIEEQIRTRVEPLAQEVRSRVEPLAHEVQTRLPDSFAKVVETGRARIQGLTGSAA